MINALQDQDFELGVQFLLNGEPSLPDDGQISWELRGHAGEVIIPRTSVLDVNDTQWSVTIPAEHLTIGTDKQFEKRSLIVVGKIFGTSFLIRKLLRVTPWLNISTTAEDVLTFLGVDIGELMPTEIDWYEAYSDTAEKATILSLEEALVSGGAREVAANRAVVASAVIKLLPSLQARISKESTDGTATIKRGDIDFDKIRAFAFAELEAALNTITGRQVIDPTFLVFTTRTDPVTG